MSLRIHVIDDIYITSDSMNTMLAKKKVVKKGKNKGKEILVPYAYFPTVRQCLEHVLEKKMNESNARSFKTLLLEHTELVAYLRGLFERVVPLKGKS